MASEIFEEFGAAFQVLLVPSQGGVFEVEMDGDRVYSKLATGRHADYRTDVAPHLRGVPS
jgi:selenoprotein W-related protein